MVAFVSAAPERAQPCFAASVGSVTIAICVVLTSAAAGETPRYHMKPRLVIHCARLLLSGAIIHS